jgi:uncharacterized protein (TIGR02001 family)
VLRVVLALLAALVGLDAAAQVAGTATVASDYRFRGVSLSDGQPAAQFDAGYDDPSGAYAGIFASNVRLYDQAGTQALAYGGYARRLAVGASLDAGASYTSFSGASEYAYSEVHAGFISDRLDAHIYLAPNYFGQSVRTLYADLNASQRLTENLRLVGHAGLLRIVAGSAGVLRDNADARAGLELGIRTVRVELSRVASQGATGVYPVASAQGKDAWTATLSVSF